MALLKLVVHAAEYLWSIVTAYLAGCDTSRLLNLTERGKICPAGEWSGQLAYSSDEEQWTERLRKATRNGRPSGNEDFVREISELAGRDLMLGLRGRLRSDGNSATLLAASVAAAG